MSVLLVRGGMCSEHVSSRDGGIRAYQVRCCVLAGILVLRSLEFQADGTETWMCLATRLKSRSKEFVRQVLAGP